MAVRFWADCDLIHLLIAGARVKTVRSHLTVNDLADLAAQGAVPPGRPAAADRGRRRASRSNGTVTAAAPSPWAARSCLAAEILAGRRVGIRIEPATLMFYDLDTRELLRTRPNPLTPTRSQRLRGARPAGPPPRPRPSRSGSSAAPPTPA